LPDYVDPRLAASVAVQGNWSLKDQREASSARAQSAIRPTARIRNQQLGACWSAGLVGPASFPDDARARCGHVWDRERDTILRMPPADESFEWSAKTEADTERFGAALASVLRTGDVIALNGQLGAGKTRLVRAVAESLGDVRQSINSPTFVLIHEYDGRVPLYHVDAYRLRDSDEFLSIGGDEVLAGDRACLIEWADRIADVLPRDHLRIDISATGETERTFAVKSCGRRSAELLREFQSAL